MSVSGIEELKLKLQPKGKQETTMHKGVIVRRVKGQTVPDALFENILKAYPSCSGMAFSKFEETPKLFTDTSDTSTTMEFLKTMQDGEWLDTSMAYYFGKYPSGFCPEDIQPFTFLTDEKGEAILAGFLVGDFKNFEKAGSAHSPEYHAAEEYFKPKMEQMFIAAGKNLTQLLIDFQKPFVARELGAQFNNEGTVLLVPAVGEHFSFESEGEENQFEWGSATDMCGYTETQEEEEKPEVVVPDKPLTMKEKLAAAKAKAAGIASGAASPMPTEPKKEPVTKEPDKKILGEPDKNGNLSEEDLIIKWGLKPADEGMKWIAPPVGANRDVKKQFYTARRNGNLVKGWKDGPPIQVPKTTEGLLKTMQEIPKDLAKAKMDTAPSKSPPVTSVPSTPKEPALPPPDVSPAKEEIPVLDGPILNHIVDTWMKETRVRAILDADNTDILDPKFLSDIEKKFPNILAQLGLKSWFQIYNMPYALHFEIAKKYPRFSAVLSFWLKNKCLSFELKEMAGTTIDTTKDTGTQHVGPGAAMPPPPKINRMKMKAG